MAGVLCGTAHRIGCNPVLGSAPVSGHGHNIILVQIIKGQGTGAAEVLRTDTDASCHRHNVGMYVSFAFHSICDDVLVVLYIRTEFVGYLANCNGSTRGSALAAGYIHRNVDNIAAGHRAFGIFRIGAQILFSGRIDLTVFQILPVFIFQLTFRFTGLLVRNFFFGTDILVGDGYFACRVDFSCTADISVIDVFQVCISQGSRSVEALFRSASPQGYGYIDLGQGVFTRNLHILYTCKGAALNAALHIVFNLTDGSSNACGNAPSVISGIGIGNVQSSGHLHVSVIGAVVDHSFLGFAVRGGGIDQ